MQTIFNGFTIFAAVLVIRHAFVLDATKARLDQLETTTTADWYSNATDDAVRSERIEMLEALKSSAIHYGDAATIRVVQGDTVTFGRWSEPVAKEEGAK